jgi:transposase InsO family protein
VELYREGHTQALIAEMVGVSRQTVSKWLHRYAAGGEAALHDLPSRPAHSPTKTPADVEELIRAVRVTCAYGPQRIATALRVPASTVYQVLARLRLNVLAALHRTTREAIRYERARPGELLHIDVKKLGRIPDGGGKRAEPGFAETGIGRQGKRGHGYDVLHVAIDDHSRYTYVEVLPDAGKDASAAFLARSVQAFADLGVTVERVLTDNALSYRSHAFRDVAGALGITLKRTRPYRPQTNGKAERVIQTLLREWAYLRPYTSNRERLLHLPVFLQEYNMQRPHAALGHRPPITRICQQRP